MPFQLLVLLTTLAWATLATHVVTTIQSGLARSGSWGAALLGLGNDYATYFTLITNVLCAAILLAHSVGSEHRLAVFLRRPGVATCAAASIIIVGVVYYALLAASIQIDGIDLVVDRMLHAVLPIGFVWAWSRLVPRGSITLRQIPWWSTYFVGYALYLMLRGAFTGSYPYFFVDVTQLGYAGALRNVVLLGLAFGALCSALVGLNRVLGAPRTSET